MTDSKEVNLIEAPDLEINKDLLEAYKKFTELLQQDLHSVLGEDTPFMIRVDFQLGADKSKEKELCQYQRVLKYLVDSVAKEVYDPKTYRSETHTTKRDSTG